MLARRSCTDRLKPLSRTLTPQASRSAWRERAAGNVGPPHNTSQAGGAPRTLSRSGSSRAGPPSTLAQVRIFRDKRPIPTHRQDAAHGLPGAARQLLLEAVPVTGKGTRVAGQAVLSGASGRQCWQAGLSGASGSGGCTRSHARISQATGECSPCTRGKLKNTFAPTELATLTDGHTRGRPNTRPHQSHWLGTGLLLSTTQSNSCTQFGVSSPYSNAQAAVQTCMPSRMRCCAARAARSSGSQCVCGDGCSRCLAACSA